MIATMNNVNKQFGDIKALDNLSINVKEGEILGLLGPNGAGKTTAIRTLCGLLDADTGETTVLNQKQSVKNVDARRDIGLVTQDITVFKDLTAAENLRYFGGLYGLRGTELKENVKEMLEFVGLTDRSNKKPGTFSGGMQRRLNIACALVHKPKLLIMDEPTVGIDPQSRNHILESVKEIAQKGTTVIYTTHYMEEVQAICDRIEIMDLGKVIAEGTMEELIGLISKYQKVNMTAIVPTPAMTAALQAVEGVTSVELHGNEYTIKSEQDSDNISKIMEVAGKFGGVSSFTEEKPNLENVFLTLTGKNLRDKGE